MTTMTIARVGLDVELPNFETLDFKPGDRVELSGKLRADSLAEVKALRQSLLAYVGNEWETELPVVFDGDDTLTGWVCDFEASVGTNPISYAANWFPFSCAFTWLGDYQVAKTQIVTLGKDRTGKPGGVTAVPWSAVPAEVTGYDRSGSAAIGYSTRTGPGGSVRWWGTATGTPYYNATATMLTRPADAYNMAPALLLGDPLRVVCGRQIPALANLTDWQVDTGLVRVTGAPAGETSHLVEVEFPTFSTPGTYGTPIALQFGFQHAIYGWCSFAPAGSQGVAPVALKVLRYDAAELTIQLSGSFTFAATTTSIECMIDLRFRRGALGFEVLFHGNPTVPYGIALDTADAATAVGSSSGIRKNTAVSGNRLIIVSGKATTPDLVNGKLHATSSTSEADFGVLCEFGGTSSAAPNTTTDVIGQYFAAVGERVKVVAP